MKIFSVTSNPYQNNKKVSRVSFGITFDQRADDAITNAICKSSEFKCLNEKYFHLKAVKPFFHVQRLQEGRGKRIVFKIMRPDFPTNITLSYNPYKDWIHNFFNFFENPQSYKTKDEMKQTFLDLLASDSI